LPNPFADGDAEMTHWFHPACAAFKRPAPFLETLAADLVAVDLPETLEHEARLGVAHRRLPRVDAASRAPSGRAMCRACKERIEKGTWRLALVYYEEGQFAQSGFMHVRCATSYLETTAVMPRVRQFSPGLSEADLLSCEADLGSTR
jgi:hypothetical protein